MLHALQKINIFLSILLDTYLKMQNEDEKPCFLKKKSKLSELCLKQEQIAVNGVRKLVSLLIKQIFKEPIGRFLF